jgi:predicted GIY-YIG superfamily endonuclease
MPRTAPSPRVLQAPELSDFDTGREDGTHSVYVVRLESAALQKKKFAEANAWCDRSKPCFYVGLTGRPVETRFAQHKSDYKASRWVRDFGIELVPSLYEPLNGMSYSTADAVEEVLARVLRSRGFPVWQN